MSEAENTPPSLEPEPPRHRPRRRGWGKLALWIGIPAVAVGLLAAPRAFAGHRFGCGGHGMHGAESADEVSEHMQKRLGWVLSKVDATDAQRAEANGIVAAAAPDIFDLSQQGKALRGQLKDAMLADEIDLEKVQSLTDEAEATMGQVARLGLETITQIAAVLEPEQRQKIQQHLERFMH